MIEAILALLVLNVGVSFKILFLQGGHGERLKNLERIVFNKGAKA